MPPQRLTHSRAAPARRTRTTDTARTGSRSGSSCGWRPARVSRRAAWKNGSCDACLPVRCRLGFSQGQPTIVERQPRLHRERANTAPTPIGTPPDPFYFCRVSRVSEVDAIRAPAAARQTSGGRERRPLTGRRWRTPCSRRSRKSARRFLASSLFPVIRALADNTCPVHYTWRMSLKPIPTGRGGIRARAETISRRPKDGGPGGGCRPRLTHPRDAPARRTPHDATRS
jgi:hypothetical protein